MTETEFTGEVLALARKLGLLAHWCRDSRRCEGDKGFPDVFVCGPGGFFFAENKLDDADTSADQDLWGWTLLESWKHLPMDCPICPWRVWTPADLEDGTIEREMRQLLP